MTMKKTTYIFTLVIALLFSACSDSYFDINKNPNSATESNMSPELLLPSILHRLAAHTGKDFAYIQHWLGYFSRSGGYGSNLDVETYAITSTFNQGSWDTPYHVAKQTKTMESKAVEKGFTAYQGVSKILRALCMSMIVDQYNNCPYSQAFDPTNRTPAYDDAKKIYEALIELLEEADNLLRDADAEKDYKFIESDIMFKGDLNKWRKFGNTLHLRLLIHQTNVLDAAGLKTGISKITANGAGFLGAGETAAVNPHYKKDKDKMNPYWSQHYKDETDKIVDRYHRCSEFFLNLTKDNNDIRYKYFLRPVGDKGNNYVGIIFGETDLDYKNSHDANATSAVAGPGIAKSVDQDQWLLTSFESLFLQAEAIQRGALAGDAKKAYEAAVKESFRWLEVGKFKNIPGRSEEVKDWENVCDTIVDNYIGNDAINPFAVWDKNADKIRLILTQKYIAMFGINGLEVWTDYRRTGIPDIPLSVHPSVSSRKIPSRLVYPVTEYDANKGNVLSVDPQTDKIFWAK